MFPFAVLDDGQRVPEAFDHDVSILPHQHEGLEELFPQAHVPTAADADEAISEADCLEQRGAETGRSGPSGDSSSSRQGGKEALSCMAASWRRAMAPQATSVACVHPSSTLQDKKNEENSNENENLQGRLPRQSPSRAMTPQATSAACVSPWHRSNVRTKTVLGSPDSLSGRPRAQGGARWSMRALPPGDCVSRTAPTTTRGSSLTGDASNSFLQKSSGGSAGNPGCSRARRRAHTVAFELLRLLKHLVQ